VYELLANQQNNSLIMSCSNLFSSLQLLSFYAIFVQSFGKLDGDYMCSKHDLTSGCGGELPKNLHPIVHHLVDTLFLRYELHPDTYQVVVVNCVRIYIPYIYFS